MTAPERIALSALFFLAALLSPAAAAEEITLLANGDIAAWEYQTFDDIPETAYRTADDADLGRPALMANSKQGASGYWRRVSLDLQKTPHLHFQWRVDEAGDGFNPREKPGDDFALRLYFISERGGLSSSGIVLVRSHLRRGESWRNPYSNWLHDLHMHVFAGGDSPLGKWQNESVDLRALWRQIYDKEPPIINAVGLMTDGDSSGVQMRARYGNIVLSSSPR